ncbi:MAG: SAM-dependent methyltransferase [Trebonia sp.]
MPDRLIQDASEAHGAESVNLDTTRAHPARVYNFWLGGKDYFAADREAGEQALAAYPDLVRGVRAQREFLAAAVRYLAAEAGIRQFFDIGTGLPVADNTHEVAQAIAPSSRIAYVDNDPMVLAHARALLTSAPEGACAYLDADVRDTGGLIQEVERILDFGEPVAIMMIGILQLVPDADDPWRIVEELLSAAAPGSWLAVAHPASDIATDQMGPAMDRYNERAEARVSIRTRAQIARFFSGLDLLPPGLVQLHRWQPGTEVAAEGELAAYCGLARKP